MSLDLSHDGNINIPTTDSSLPMMSPLSTNGQFHGLGDSNTQAYGLNAMQLHQLLCMFYHRILNNANMIAAQGGYSFQNGENMHSQSPVAYVPVFVVGGNDSMPDMSPYVYVPMAANSNGSVSEMRTQTPRKGSMGSSRAMMRREEML
jgi:hypothetical protein